MNLTHRVFSGYLTLSKASFSVHFQGYGYLLNVPLHLSVMQMLMQMLKLSGAMPSKLDFSIAFTIVLQLQLAQGFLHFLSAISTGVVANGLGHDKGLSVGTSSWQQSLHIFPPEHTHCPQELFHCLQLREFSFCYFLHYCVSSICPLYYFQNSKSELTEPSGAILFLFSSLVSSCSSFFSFPQSLRTFLTVTFHNF